MEEFDEVSEIDKDRAVVRPCVEAGETAEYPEMMFSNGMKPNWEEYEADEKPTGNYIRVIMRTAEDGQLEENAKKEVSKAIDKDNIIEDVEDYFELDKRNLSDECPMKLQTTDIPEDYWVQCVVAYASEHGSDAVFQDSESMHKFYRLCVENEMNPDFLFVRAIGETSLHNSDTENYWGWGVPNGAGDKRWGTWDETLVIVCKGIVNNYVDQGGEQYSSILSRYNERRVVTENGGIPRFGYGMPDTVPGVMSVYSWLGDEHIEGSSGEGGRYYLNPASGSEIYTEDNYESLCVGPHGSGPTTVWEQGSYTAHQVRGMLNLAHNVWPTYYPEIFHNELWY